MINVMVESLVNLTALLNCALSRIYWDLLLILNFKFPVCISSRSSRSVSIESPYATSYSN